MISTICLTDTGRIQGSNSLANPTFIAGLAYLTGIVAIDDGAVAASDTFNNGFRVTSTGALRVYDATAGLPADTSINHGFTMTDEGQVCISTDPITDSYSLAGFSFDADGRVYMDML